MKVYRLNEFQRVSVGQDTVNLAVTPAFQLSHSLRQAIVQLERSDLDDDLLKDAICQSLEALAMAAYRKNFHLSELLSDHLTSVSEASP